MKRKPGEATPVIPKRYDGEDDLLAAIRDIHVRILALIDRQDFRDWLVAAPDEKVFRQTIRDLGEAQRFFYQLRGGRAIAVVEADKLAASGDRS